MDSRGNLDPKIQEFVLKVHSWQNNQLTKVRGLVYGPIFSLILILACRSHALLENLSITGTVSILGSQNTTFRTKN